MDEERTLDLLIHWDDLRLQGRDISPEELCVDCPDLLEQVRQQIERLKATAWMDRRGDEPTLSPPPITTVQKTLGKFRLDALIGTGGFGEVWRAFDPVLKRDVAIKIARPEKMTSFDRFIEEACKVARLPKHTGIVQVFDAGRDGDRCYIVSAFIDGCTLADRIQRDRPDVPTAIEWVAQIADALHYAHGEKIIHRDIKPANILLGKDGRPVVTDFGIAVNEDETIDLRTGNTGTLAYMSPEQLEGKPADRRTDIYSLGVVLYEMLTGRLPFDAKSPFDVQKAILEGRPKPPSQINEKIPERVERICLKAMALNPVDRYSTAEAFSGDVRAYLSPHGPWRKLALVGGTAILILASFAGRWGWNAREDARVTGRQVEQQTIQVQDQVDSLLAEVGQNTGPSRPKASPKEPSLAGGPATDDRQKGLPRLSFSVTTVDLTGHELSDADFEQLGRHLVLRRLVLTDTPTTDDRLAQLRSIPGLERLDLSGTQVTDAGVMKLTAFAALHDLSLARTGVSNEGMKAIGKLRLRKLDLSRTKITDEGMKQLAQRYGAGDSLSDLDLTGTNIDDAAVPSLITMSRLKRLVVTETALSDHAVEQLSESLSTCRIER